MLDYVFIDPATAWRLNWYNQIKIPQLSTALLLDSGDNMLGDKIAELHKIVGINM
jgi:hypothetical protein